MSCFTGLTREKPFGLFSITQNNTCLALVITKKPYNWRRSLTRDVPRHSRWTVLIEHLKAQPDFELYLVSSHATRAEAVAEMLPAIMKYQPTCMSRIASRPSVTQEIKDRVAHLIGGLDNEMIKYLARRLNQAKSRQVNGTVPETAE